jgi:F-type H+-transporting ATPase subunit epsilon
MFKLVVISPEKKVLETDIQSVTIPTTEGEITVLPKHMAIFSLVKPGEIIVRTKEGNISLAGGGGFVNITADTVTLLLEYGTKSDEMDEVKIQEAKKRAEEILKNQSDNKSTALASATLARSLLELKLVQKRKVKR